MGPRLDRFVRTWSMDLRSLGVLRICLGLMILTDMAIRSVDLSDHYSDAGILPRSFQELRYFSGHPTRFSFHMWSGETAFQAALFGLSALLAIFLVVGYRTRLSLLASLVLMISLQNRNAEIETGGDYLLRLVCFWGLFLPLASRFSLDHRAGRGSPGFGGKTTQPWFFSAATLAFIGQMSFVYVFSALHKHHPIWTTHHTAIHYALHIDAYDTWLGGLLREMPVVTAAITRATLQFEFLGIYALVICGLLSLIPGFEEFWQYQGPVRTCTVLAFICFHLALGATLSLGTFPWFAAIIWLAFIPTWGWEFVAKWHRKLVRREKKRNKLAKERKGTPKSATSPALIFLLSGMTAIEFFAHRFETPISPKKDNEALFPASFTRPFAWLQQGVVVLALAYTLLWNLATLKPETYNAIVRGQVSPFPDARPVIDWLRLDQHWGLFAPYPRTSDGWYVVLGEKKNGSKIDFLQDDYKLTWKKPDDVSGSYKTFRWRKYFRNLRRGTNRVDRALYSDYVCSTYNATRKVEDELDRVSIYFMRRETRAEGGYEPTKKERLSVRSCSEKTAAPSERNSLRPPSSD